MSNAVFPAVRGRTFTFLRTPEFNTIRHEAPNFVSVRVAQTNNPRWHWLLNFDYLKDYDIQGGFSYTDMRTLLGFFAGRHARFDDFLWTDPDDNAVGPTLVSGAPNPLATQQLFSDGAGNYYTPIQRNLGGQFYEDVTDLNPLNGSGLTLNITTGAGNFPAVGYVLGGPGLGITGHSFMGMYVAWAWRAGATYAANSTVIDPNGHLQFTAAGGTAQTPGPPTWNDSGGTTTDNTITWQDEGTPTAITANFSFYFRVEFEEDTQDFEKFLRKLWTIGGSESRNGSGQLKFMSSRPQGV